ncbi:RWD domain-containing protein 2A [Drosophila tropicalis]|uniref:RWD domain-containing protein 2A n=1 Tax=Drosophila tropicalis TaxID=46794 RepID=UPI0035ABC635
MMMADENEQQIYRGCISQQLEELELLSYIYCKTNELQLLDPSVVTDYNEYLEKSHTLPAAHLEYIIKLPIMDKSNNIDVRIELPHLYPKLEKARISVHSSLLGKLKEEYLQQEITKYLEEQQEDDTEPYIYQLLSWLQDQMEVLLKRPASEFTPKEVPVEADASANLERMWIYSHHIKSTTKRQELIRQARQLKLSGFSRPGKPGIICIEGDSTNVQEYWRSIKSLRWQKITLVRTETKQRKRRFENFTEQLFNAEGSSNSEEGIMNMGQFIKFLDDHGSGYMKAELFGLA